MIKSLLDAGFFLTEIYLMWQGDWNSIAAPRQSRYAGFINSCALKPE
jgi:hypothetical protein